MSRRDVDPIDVFFWSMALVVAAAAIAGTAKLITWGFS